MAKALGDNQDLSNACAAEMSDIIAAPRP